MDENKKGKQVGYWLTTAVLAIALIAAGVMDLMQRPEISEIMGRLGHPPYLAPLLGVAKLLAAIAILAPGFPRLKEWAYAGIVIDFGGAMYSHIAAGEPEQTVAPVLLILVAFASWYLRPPERKLPDPIKVK